MTVAGEHALPLTVGAATLAREAHAGQRYGALPYYAHLSDVFERVRDAVDRHETPLRGCRDEVLAAAWLHDLFEDAGVDREAVAGRFGPFVTAVVDACTGKGANRKQRVRALYDNFDRLRWHERAHADVASPWPGLDVGRVLAAARLVKACDRLSNVESCWSGRDPRLFMYEREHRDFVSEVFGGNADPAVAAVLAELDRVLGRSP